MAFESSIGGVERERMICVVDLGISDITGSLKPAVFTFQSERIRSQV